MILSIGMIVKNEEKYLRACLTSIKPILEEIHSELIIYDTGSTDATVQIAKEFTDQVYVIAWRNDFAWARNHTVDKAKGEWFMFFDADEEFTDLTDLIAFFKTGEYKKYKCASYRWRNMFDGGMVGEFRPMRLFEKDKDLRFVGRIHESIKNKAPLKSLESVANHYGYDFSGEDGIEKGNQKFERNISLLLEMHEEDPKNVRTMGLLAQDYSARNPAKSREFIQLGLKQIGKNVTDIYYHVFYSMLIRNYYTSMLYEDAIKTSQEYLKKINYEHQALVVIYHHYANSCMMVRKHKEALKASKETLKYYDLNEKGKLDPEICGFFTLPGDITNNRTIHAKTLVLAAILECDFDTALEYLPQCEDETIDVFSLYLQDCIERKAWDDIPALYAYAIKCGNTSDHYNNILSLIETYITDEKIKTNISKAISSAPSLKDVIDDYRLLSLLRYANVTSIKTGHTTNHSTGLDYFLKSGKSFNYRYGDVILFSMKWLTNFSKFLENMTITNTTRLTKHIMATNSDTPNILRRFIEMGRWDTSSIKVNRILALLSTIAFEKIKKTKNDDEKIVFFEMTIKLNHDYLSLVYNPNMYSAQNVTALSEHDAFIYYAGIAYKCKNDGDVLSFVQNLRTAVAINPSMKDIVWLVMTKTMEELNA